MEVPPPQLIINLYFMCVFDQQNLANISMMK